MEEDMTQGEQIERLTRETEQRKILEIVKESGKDAVIQYLEQELKK